MQKRAQEGDEEALIALRKLDDTARAKRAEGISPYLILLDGKEGFTDAAAVVLRQRLRDAAEEKWV